MPLHQHDQDAMGKKCQAVVMSGHGFDEEISRLVNQERLPRYFYTPLRFDAPTRVVSDSALDFLPGSTRRDNAREYSFPCVAPLFELFERPFVCQDITGTLSDRNDLHDPSISHEVVKCPTTQLTENFSQ